jgi:phage baseplate assembly protein W
MANVPVPHFAIPFVFDHDHHARVNQQNSADDVVACVQAILRTYKGKRLYVPNFGIDDPTFAIEPININAIQRAIETNEPRAAVVLGQEVDRLIDTVMVEVGILGS